MNYKRLFILFFWSTYLSVDAFSQYYNELGINFSSNQYITSIYFKKYWGNSAKTSSQIQFGTPATTTNLHNFSMTIGSNWYLKEGGKKLSIGVICQVQRINESGYINETDPTAGAPQGPFYYENKGYQLTVAPELGWNFTLSKAVYFHPYAIPLALDFINGTTTKDYTVDPNAKSSSSLDTGIRTSLAQSLGIKLGFRF